MMNTSQTQHPRITVWDTTIEGWPTYLLDGEPADCEQWGDGYVRISSEHAMLVVPERLLTCA